ncbi:hypothetical protein EC973_002084 [Apophysomyces ossiformis]|uniref:Uncharacterized protein n=1 Tax=Apophysomyces ossiformis TaxID=679940 RepID=A0A8H7BIR8_9FUNG|nr:hypothetical protein EC973_002084 [Apophysomyces ossiformis]
MSLSLPGSDLSSSTSLPSATETEANVAVPTPLRLHPTTHYPLAPVMLPHSSASLLELHIQHDVLMENKLLDKPTPCSTCTLPGQTEPIFYRPQLSLAALRQSAQEGTDIPPHLIPYVSLYSAESQRLMWRLINKDWQDMIFQAADDNNQTISLTTSAAEFSFQWTDQTVYHWRPVPAQQQQSTTDYDLRCYASNGHLVAEFMTDRTRFVLWPTMPNQTNPFRSQQQAIEDPFTTFLLLSGFLIIEHITFMLRSLGNDTEALRMIMDPTTVRKKTPVDDAASSVDMPYVEDDLSLVHQRWSSGSTKSIELDPGFWHCWWGNGCWWTWCPCCMPGGWCDRLWIKLRGQSQSRPRRKGWQQQY